MIVKAIKPVRDIRTAVSYCMKLEDYDDPKKRRDPRHPETAPHRDVVELRGSRHDLIDVVERLHFRGKYKSFLFAWSPGENPTEEQIQRLLDDFARLAFAGLAKSRFVWCAFKHTTWTVSEDSKAVARYDIHVLIAAVDLATEKHFNPVPPGWAKRYYPLRDYYNALHGWSDPKDPLLSRLWQPGREPLYAKKIRDRLQDEEKSSEPMEPAAGLTHKATIAHAMIDLYANRQLVSHPDVMRALNARVVTAEVQSGRSSIRVEVPNLDLPILLRGNLFRTDFTLGRLMQIAREKAERRKKLSEEKDEWSKLRAHELVEYFLQMEAQVRKWSDENHERYFCDGERVVDESTCNINLDALKRELTSDEKELLPKRIQEKLLRAEQHTNRKLARLDEIRRNIEKFELDKSVPADLPKLKN